MLSAAVRATLAVELWTSWASMLRVYAAAHGLSSTRHAVVEVGAEEIVLRADTRWVRFSPGACTSSEGIATAFTLNEDGTVTLGEQTEDLDIAAERVARELLLA